MNTAFMVSGNSMFLRALVMGAMTMSLVTNLAALSTNTDCASVIVLPKAIGIIGLNGCYIGIIPEFVGLIYKYNWYKFPLPALFLGILIDTGIVISCIAGSIAH